MKLIDGIPRRNRIDLYSRSETAIRNAIISVEEAGAHPLLTDAVVLLQEAQNKVADFIELDDSNSSINFSGKVFIKMNFGQAIEAMKSGKKVQRNGWNGKGMFVVYMPPLYLPPYNNQEPGPKVNDRTAKHIGNDTPLDSQGYFAMFTAQKQWQPGWLASQADMLAEDWQEIS